MGVWGGGSEMFGGKGGQGVNLGWGGGVGGWVG
jgi:hypothetical protein